MIDKSVSAGECPYCGSTDVYGGYNLDKDMGSSDEESILMTCQDGECGGEFFVYYKFIGAEKND